MLVLALLPAASWARLGEGERTVESDRRALRAQQTTITEGAYRIHEFHTGLGQTVREYIAKDGTIFAVYWRGPRQPDLSKLLGSYYDEYRWAESSSPKSVGRAPRIVTSDNIVIHKFGHMGDVRGRAYIPNFVPDGVNPNELN